MVETDELLKLALAEDLGSADVTTLSTIPADLEGSAIVFGREPFVLSGSKPFRRIFELLDPEISIECLFPDGERIEPNVTVFRIEGRVRTLLSGERTALNFAQRLSGIATMTRKMVDAIGGAGAQLLDTRKTTPLWRSLEKEAVRHGGGRNHRFGLSDGILIKDNHIAAAGGVAESVRRARENAPHTLRVEVEVENIEQLREALTAGADIVLLDNFSREMLKEAVAVAKGRVLLEASGGVSLETVRAIAETGVDFVSCGALTHSARAIDLSMEMSCTG
ncbi:MAG: carboxylating nicotinate-nucleotide diphosphorylase [Deltaproteobacteria bacterium]|jgi:nicotinate-nucleotide pyrophosphorylase (carboxylating)|nr:carboxylating nicotinate-nucleotide diphosphorylase [Deltaproteobacteria bacterium]MDA8308532.1 carboxylating nicotinate-nucleotide diphosphorylase [Deltaproteobacteria bacterium]